MEVRRRHSVPRGERVPSRLGWGVALLTCVALSSCGPSPDRGGDAVAETSGETAARAADASGAEAGRDTVGNGVTIEYLAHASFLVTGVEGDRILIDPYQSRVWLGYDFPEGVDADAVLVTHPHYDHDAGVFRGAPFPWPDTPTIREPGETEVGEIRVLGVEGKHADPYGEEFGQINTIFVVESGGLRIAHLGDNGPLTEVNVEEMGRIDILMIPADGLYHILSAEATDAAIEALGPRLVVPMHYRIGALESEPDDPSDLGDLDPWLDGRGPIERATGNRATFTLDALPTDRTIFVFRHSPAIPPPD